MAVHAVTACADARHQPRQRPAAESRRGDRSLELSEAKCDLDERRQLGYELAAGGERRGDVASPALNLLKTVGKQIAWLRHRRAPPCRTGRGTWTSRPRTPLADTQAVQSSWITCSVTSSTSSADR